MDERLSAFFSRFGLLLIAAAAVLVSDISIAHAQSASCSQLQRSLRTLENNSNFRELESAEISAQQYAQAVQDAESSYVRAGCVQQQQQGQLTRECRVLARQILSGRSDRDTLYQRVETGTSVAQQREAVLQEIARFGCNAERQAGYGDELDGGFRRERNSVFDNMFGNGQVQDGQIINDGYGWGGYGGYVTVRTVCVRMSDGYFWPISYSTLTEYAGQDAQTCQAQCPNQQVGLYFYENPGQEPEQMVNLYGEPYTNLPNAFAYRRAIDPANSCKIKQERGTITLAEGGDTGSGRPMITYLGQSFPLPSRDPRQPGAQPMQVAEIAPAQMVEVPLPRRRPTGDAHPQVTPAADPNNRQARVVQFDGKRVRIVGPETPYAQAVEAGT